MRRRLVAPLGQFEVLGCRAPFARAKVRAVVLHGNIGQGRVGSQGTIGAQWNIGQERVGIRATIRGVGAGTAESAGIRGTTRQVVAA